MSILGVFYVFDCLVGKLFHRFLLTDINNVANFEEILEVASIVLWLGKIIVVDTEVFQIDLDLE